MFLELAQYAKADLLISRDNLVLKLAKAIPDMKCNVPEGAFYVFPEVSAFFGKSHNGKTINNGTDLSLYLLEEAHVAIVPGAAFGNDNYIRFSYATSEDRLTEAMKRMKSTLEKLN